MAKTLETTIKMGGKLDPSLQASVKAAEAMITKTASTAALAAQREQRVRSAAILKQTQLDQKMQLKAQHVAEKAELKRQQLTKQSMTKQERMAEQAALKQRQRAETEALNAQQIAERTAVQRANIEQEASNKITAIREKEAQKMQAAAKKASEAAAKEAEKRIKKIQAQLDKLGKAMTKYVTMPLMALGVMAVKKFMEFDDAMRKVQATLHATPGDMVKLTAAAKKMGRETRYTAVQAAGALESIGQAGYDAAQSILILPKALKAAQAFDMSIDDAASYLTGSMATFGITPDYLERFTDQAATAAATFLTDTQSMLDAGLRVGTIADYLRDGTVELFTMTGVLSNAKIEGEQAGTQLRTIISSLAAPAPKGAKALKQLGVSVEDTDGKLRSMNDIFFDINQGMERLGMSDTKRIDTFKTIFGDRAFASADALAKYAGDQWDVASAIVDNSEGTTQRMAETMEGGIGGMYRSMSSAAEGALIEAGEIISPAAEKLMGIVTDVLNTFSNADESTQQFIVAVGGAAVVIGPGMLIAKNLLRLRSYLSGVNKAAETAGTGWLGLAGKIGSLGPLAKFALAAAAVAGIGLAVKATSDAITQAELEKRFGEIELSAEQIQTVASAIKTPFTEALTEINAMFTTLNQHIADLKTTDLSLKTELIALPTTVGVTEVEELAGKYNAYVDSIKSSLATYEGLHKIEIQTVFGDGDPNGDALQEKFSEYYGGLTGRAQEIGALLKSEFETALLSGQVDKAKVREYQNQLAEVWAEIQSFETRSELYALAEGLSNNSLSYGSTTELFTAIQESTATSLAGINEMQNRLIGNTRALYADDPTKGDEQVAAIRARMDQERAQLLTIQAEVMNQYMPDAMRSVFEGAPDMTRALDGINLYDFFANYLKMHELANTGDYAGAAALQQQLEPVSKVISEAFDNASISTGIFGSDARRATEFWNDSNAEQLKQQLAATVEASRSSGDTVSPEIIKLYDSLSILEGIANYGLGADMAARQMQYLPDYSEYLASAESAAKNSATSVDAATSSVTTSASNMASSVSSSMNSMESDISRFANQKINVNVSGAGSAPGMSKGGTVTSPKLVWIGEGLYDETVVPHNDSARSRSLLAEAAAGVGVGFGGAQYVFAPQITIQGNADAQQVDDALEAGFEQFKAWMQELERERGSTSLGA